MCLITRFSFALYVMTCFTSFVLAMLALCHLVWVSLISFASFHLCFHVYACVFVCLFVSSRIIPIYYFVRAHTRLCTRNPKSLLGTFLDGSCLICIPIRWNHRHEIQTHICPSRTPFFVCLFAPLHAFFICLPISQFFVNI